MNKSLQVILVIATALVAYYLFHPLISALLFGR